MADVLIQLFSDVLGTDPTELNDDSSPASVARWDSVASMSLVSAIEEKFAVRLGTREIMKMSTIGRARKTLREKGVDV